MAPKQTGARRSANAAPKPARRRSAKPRGPGKPFTRGNPYAWKPGESGNPQGQQGPKVSDLLREAMAQRMPKNARRALADLIAADATIGQIIGFAVALRAAAGDLEAVAVIGDRTEGAPDQHILLTDLTADDLARARAKAQAWEQEHESVDAETVPSGPAPQAVGHV